MAEKPRKQRAENAARRSLQMVEATLRSVARNGLKETTLASVSREAGLSQGVAVFYFESKDRLLAAAFRHHYEVYRHNWQTAVAAAGDDPASRVAAAIRADFDAIVFNREALAVWYAFWGDTTARPIYADISKEFDGERNAALGADCAGLVGGDAEHGRALASAIDALTDGLWLRAHLSQPWVGAEWPLRLTASAVARLLPGAGDRIARELTGARDDA
ncbi:MAG TPA: TetR family transcriptional regulator C-terminal domain-containing protein [Paracoccaceae bacterium]|nr:TetR family transcriptional regulator C-terminal domain-containing protein [Paracoccaceae bacterium]